MTPILFESEVFISIFTKVFMVIAVFVMIIMPFACKKMKREAEGLCFLSIIGITGFTVSTAIFFGHLATIYNGEVSATLITYVLGLCTVVCTVLFHDGFFQYIWDNQN